MNISNSIAGMSPNEIAFEIQRGGRFVVYQYCFSIIFMTFKRNAPVRFVRAGESASAKGLPFTLLTLVVGWWGIPWGFIYTPQVIYKNLKGGVDVTHYVLNQLQRPAPPPAGILSPQP
jgi:hypothetical protein